MFCFHKNFKKTERKNAFMIQRQHVAECFLDFTAGQNSEFLNKNVSVFESSTSKKNTMGMMNKKWLFRLCDDILNVINEK